MCSMVLRRPLSSATTSVATAAALFAIVAGGVGLTPRTAASSVGGSGASQVYRKAPTVACLRQEGVAIAPIKPIDRRLRALRDLAQKTSWQARKGSAVVGASLSRNADDAQFLLELLRVPRDRYRLVARGNAVLLYLPAASGLAAVVRGCLR